MAIWLKERNQDKAIKLILFLISPFFSFVYSLKRINTRSSFIVFFLFAVFFGISFTVDINSHLDGGDYRRMFEEYSNTNYHTYYSNLQEFLDFSEGNKKDMYFDTVSYYLSRITDNYHVMFMFLAIVFAFFSLKSFRFFTSEYKFDATLSSYILAFLFMSNGIFNINGVRMYTAGWIGVYALLQIFGKNNKFYFLLLLITPFFHGSFWFLVAIVVLAFLFMQFEKIWIVMFFTSFFVGSIAVEFLHDVSDILPSFLQNMIASYTDPQYIALKSKTDSYTFDWVTRLMSFSVRFYLNFMVFLFIKNSRSVKANPKTRHFYLFILVYMTFVNFTMPVPSLGSRFLLFSYPIIAYVWLVNFKEIQYTKVLYVMPFVFWLTIYSRINYYLLVLEPSFFISNPFYLIYKYLII